MGFFHEEENRVLPRKRLGTESVRLANTKDRGPRGQPGEMEGDSKDRGPRCQPGEMEGDSKDRGLR